MNLICLRNILRARDQAGQPLPKARLYLYHASSDNLAATYANQHCIGTLANPLVSDQNGLFEALFLPDGLYRIVLTDQHGDILMSEDKITHVAETSPNAIRVFKNIADLLADTTLRYAPDSSLENVSLAGHIKLADCDYCYNIADYDATDHHLTTAAGLRLYVKPSASGYNVKAFGAIGDGITDDTASINKAITALPMDASLGGRLIFPSGRYLTDGGHVFNVTGHQVVGFGIDSTRIVLNPSTSHSGVFILGNKLASSVVKHISLKDLRIEMQGADKYGIEMYGCRDGSEIANVYISDFSGGAVRLNMAGNGAGVATSKMNQGVKLTQVVCESSRNITALNGVFDIDGTFETTLDTCAFKGASVATNNGTAISIGHEAECRNVVVLNTALPHLSNGGTGGNIGIHYGQWARECRDMFTTFENIDGHAVLFDGSQVSGSNLPFQCYSLYPRLYNVNEIGVLDPAFVFGDASSCRVGPITNYNSSKTWAKFNNYNYFQEHNLVEVGSGDVNPDAISGSNIDFGQNTPGTNVVLGQASSDSTLRCFAINRTGASVDHKPNGSKATYSASWDTIDLGSDTGIRWRDSSGEDLFQLTKGGSLGVDQTIAYLRYRGTAGEAIQRVRVGAENSGGQGYRALIIAN